MLKVTKKGKKRGQGFKSLLVPFSKMLIAGGFLATLSGCSALNIGESEYACPGMPNGVQCMSAREVYAETDNGRVPRPMSPEDVEKQAEADSEDEETRKTSSEKVERDEVIDNYVSPRLPNKPVPIRTPAQVMRIWVAPWEDTNGDLIVTGYVYTEIEPRRWVIGKGETGSEPVFRPLQSGK